MTLSRLLQGIIEVPATMDRQISSLTLDSRAVLPGSLFCATKGTITHGLDFVAQAQARGAVAIICEPNPAWSTDQHAQLAANIDIPLLTITDLNLKISTIAGRFYGDPGFNLDLIGITGTNGKTSVSQIIAQALTPDQCCGVVGTLGYGINNKFASTGHTTPDAVQLQSILAKLLSAGAKTVAMEISSHALAQNRAAGLPINTAIFTNLTRDHLDYHHNLGAYAQAKGRLFKMPGLRHAILNADDPISYEILATLHPKVEPIFYSLTPGYVPKRPKIRWLRLEFMEHQPRGMRLWIIGSWGNGGITVPMMGYFNAANILAALAALILRAPNQNLGTALHQLGRVKGVPGRMECFGNHTQPLVVVDYAHTPDALEQVLKELKMQQPQRLICVFGCGGDRDKGKRPQMGNVAERLSDMVILTDDNPRHEDGDHIIQDILSGTVHPDAIHIQRQREAAIQHALTIATPKDIVLIAGKGHETTQNINGVEHQFSDRLTVVKLLNSRFRP
ncbi:hypothetical protein TI04_06050 [Achromatium sp. WMS2]|nr:hypothetical protein TI04_06050 [Achromatium sp. WMS2]